MAGDVVLEIRPGVVDGESGGRVGGQVERGEGEADGAGADEGDVLRVVVLPVWV